MNRLINDYQSHHPRPVVLLTRQRSAGMLALRWRLRGTQRFVNVTDDDILPLLLDHEQRNGTHRTGQYEIARLNLNHRYALAYHYRRRQRSLQIRLNKLAETALL